MFLNKGPMVNGGIPGLNGDNTGHGHQSHSDSHLLDLYGDNHIPTR